LTPAPIQCRAGVGLPPDPDLRSSRRGSAAGDDRHRAQRPNPAKLEPYECGIEATTFAHDTRFSVRYFLIAVLFVVFDVETIFLFPWAVMFNRLGLFGLVEMLVFLVILVVGYFYVWKRKALDWA
jgi:NADH-quinone oxidoreductase subunit A